MNHSCPRSRVVTCPLLVVLAFVLTPSLSRAQNGTAGIADTPFRSQLPIRIERIEGPISLDGMVNEPAWDGLTPLPWHVYDPSYGAPSSQQTEFRIGFDDDFLYFSCRCFDTEPDKVQATSYKRDTWDATFDQVALILDTFNDNENSVMFILSASGARTDLAVLSDAQGDNPFNMSWNTFWDGETVIDESGWQAEVRIPLTSLRFNTVDDATMMGVSVYRYIPRATEMHVYPERHRDWGFFSFFKPSIAQDAVFSGIQSRKALYITPYAIGGVTQSHELNGPGTAYDRIDDPSYDVGVDLKYGITNNLTVDLTVNTDFAQVEADDAQVNLTRFSLFFPEQRLFFQERNANFEFNMGDSNRLFYSRRIGIDDGDMIPLLGGARIVGRIGRWDLGALSMQSARHQGTPTENFGVLRLRRQVLNPNSYAGGILTTRMDRDGGQNVGLGVDGIFRLGGDEYLTLNAAHTFDEETDTGFDATRIRMYLRSERETGFSHGLDIHRAGIDYRPDLGFELRENYTQISTRLGYYGVSGDGARFKQWQVRGWSDWYGRNADRSTETLEVNAFGRLQTWAENDYQLTLTTTYDDLREDFELSDNAVIPVGAYTFLSGKLWWETPSYRLLRTSTTVTAGQFYDGSRMGISTNPRWALSPVVTLSGTYSFDRVDFPDRDQAFTAHLARLKAQFTFNRAWTFSTYVQMTTASDAAVANVRLRYNPREGQDFYLVYNEGYNTDRFDSRPALPWSETRTLLLKYSHTLVR